MKSVFVFIFIMNLLFCGKLIANNTLDSCKIWVVDLSKDSDLKNIYSESLLNERFLNIRKIFIAQYSKCSNDIIIVATEEETRHLNYILNSKELINLPNSYIKLQLLYNKMDSKLTLTYDKINRNGQIINTDYVDFHRDDLFKIEMNNHINSLLKKIFSYCDLSSKTELNEDESEILASKPTNVVNDPIFTTEARIKQRGSFLSEDEVRNLFVRSNNYNSLDIYEKALSQQRWKKGMNYTGGFVIGVCVMFQLGWMEEVTYDLAKVGIVGIGFGGACLIIAGILNSASKKNMGKAVLKYNIGDYTSEVHFGIVTNGIGFAYTF